MGDLFLNFLILNLILMNRIHINLKVADLQNSVRFYNAMFQSEPTVLKDDYAKWMLEEPLVNFSIVESSDQPGIEHLGIQTESQEGLQDLYNRVDQAAGKLREEGDTICCYAKSTKGWVTDPSGVEWEMFHTTGESLTFRGDSDQKVCCA